MPRAVRGEREGELLIATSGILGARAGERGPVLIRGSRIAALGADARREARRRGARVIELDGCVLAPGFVDLHTHGAVGVDFVRASSEEFERSLRHYAAHGVTALLVSLYPTPWRESLEVISRVAGFIEKRPSQGVAIGLHLEGPFLDPKRPGALPVAAFRPPSVSEARRLLDAGRGLVRTMTIAPELEGGAELVRFLVRRGVVPAFGHSSAGYEAARRAIRLGARYATHLFNAMTGLHHRQPGAVTAFLEDGAAAVEVISDGHHISVPVLRLIHRLAGGDRIILVSDSAMPCGLPEGRYDFAGAPVDLRGGRIQLPDGTLAGSALTLDRAVRLQVEEVGASPEEAIARASRNPARAIGLERTHGLLARGRRADVVALDSRFRVQATWAGGRLLHWRSGKPPV